MEKSYTETTYVICHNGADVIHPVKAEPGTNLASGQPEFEEFADEAAWKARLTELGFDITKLDPPSARAEGLRAHSAGEGRPGALLTPEERKSLSPEERKALRAERMAALASGAVSSETEAPKAPAKARRKKASS
jgi:hypothetical protein